MLTVMMMLEGVGADADGGILIGPEYMPDLRHRAPLLNGVSPAEDRGEPLWG